MSVLLSNSEMAVAVVASVSAGWLAAKGCFAVLRGVTRVKNWCKGVEISEENDLVAGALTSELLESVDYGCDWIDIYSAYHERYDRHDSFSTVEVGAAKGEKETESV